jgi:hypothetical protein
MDALRKQIRRILEEANIANHYRERLYDRFLNRDKLDVGYEVSNGIYETVGTYIIPPDKKSIILENAKVVENYNFPKNKSIGVQIAYIIIDKNKVQYFDNDTQNQLINKNLVFVDSQTNSNGNEVYIIVRNNEVLTVYFAKSYIKQDANKLNVDVIVKNISVLKNKQFHQ